MQKYSGEGLTHPEDIGVIINTDGVALFKSSRLKMWPIYLALTNLPPLIRMNMENIIVCGMWIGVDKPDMTTLLRGTVRMLENARDFGLRLVTPNGPRMFHFKPLIGVFDLVAKAPILNMHQFNGKYGCSSCLIPGVWNSGSRRYLPGEKYPRRTHNSILTAANQASHTKTVVKGIKGPSILKSILNLVDGVPLDYMHNVLEGVVKRMLHCWFDSQNHAEHYYIGRSVKQVDKLLLNQRPPIEFSRAPRSIELHLKYWKANEFRAWLLFYSVPLLVGVLPPLFLHHYSLLVCAVHILLQNELTVNKIMAADELLSDFCDLLPELYGAQNCTFNAHSLIHLSYYAKLWGPLWTHSAFGFESMNGHLHSIIHGKKKVIDQLVLSANVVQATQQLHSKLLSVESEQTISFLNFTSGHISRHNMSLISTGNYSVGRLLQSTLTQQERQAIHTISCHPIGTTTMFSRAYLQNVLYYSAAYNKDGKRNNCVCSFKTDFSEEFGEIQKFVLCQRVQAVALIKKYKKCDISILVKCGLPCRPILDHHKSIDLISNFVITVEVEDTELRAIPVARITGKCTLIELPDIHYVVKMPNKYEHH